ncbi:MAG: hypothetical protein AABN95_02765 [Acidobacteriota bacterium]
MNDEMHDDYLWDKSGKPDPDIQQLEEILGTLRYQPRELEIPAHVQMGRQTLVSRGLAIAAAVALVVLGLGLWMSLNRQRTTEISKIEGMPVEVDNSSRPGASPVDEKKVSNLQAAAPEIDQTPEATPTSLPRRHPASAGNRRRNLELRRPEMSESELAEARAAKDQLMLALRLASSKLSLAQKKTQGINSANEIHNQHKTG